MFTLSTAVLFGDKELDDDVADDEDKYTFISVSELLKSLPRLMASSLLLSLEKNFLLNNLYDFTAKFESGILHTIMLFNKPCEAPKIKLTCNNFASQRNI